MENIERMIKKFQSREARIGVIGLGYVGLPLVLRFCDEGFTVAGFDTDLEKVRKLLRGESYIRYINPDRIGDYVKRKRFEPTTDMDRLSEPDAIIICVPTPLTARREPDMQYVSATANEMAARLRPGQIVSLESTTYPGTTEEILLPLFRGSGYRVGKDFFLVFSPEREDPGRNDFTTRNTPKVVGGTTPECLKVGEALYGQIVDMVVPVSSTKAAEMAKLLENIYRAVNISLVNELKVLCDRMGIDLWEVIEAAKTKPFGFHAFYPGPGLGGHCIPIDPFYLTWKAREYDFSTRFIELTGEINASMPYYVVEWAMKALNEQRKSLAGSRVLVLGIAYKKDIDDPRESPALRIISILKSFHSTVLYNDPHIPICKGHRHYPDIDMVSVACDEETIASADLVILVTDHSAYDYAMIERHARVILDTRDAFRRNGLRSEKVVRA